jgi:hypothetical protein
MSIDVIVTKIESMWKMFLWAFSVQCFHHRASKERSFNSQCQPKVTALSVIVTMIFWVCVESARQDADKLISDSRKWFLDAVYKLHSESIERITEG